MSACLPDGELVVRRAEGDGGGFELYWQLGHDGAAALHDDALKHDICRPWLDITLLP